MRKAIIHSLDKTEDKFRDVEVIEYNNTNDVIVLYEGKKYHAIDNAFTGYLYVDDVLGIIYTDEENEKLRLQREKERENFVIRMNSFLLDYFKDEISENNKYAIYNKGSLHNCYESLSISGIITKLIQEAGKCKCYASDILYNLYKIMDGMKHCTIKSEIYWFGFRDCGVDYIDFIYSRLYYDKYSGLDEYNSIYKLDVVVDTDNDLLEMRLCKLYQK